MKMNKLIMYADYALNVLIAILCMTFIMFYPTGWLFAELQITAWYGTTIMSSSEYMYNAMLDILIIGSMCIIVGRICVLCVERMDEIANTLKGGK